MPLCGNQILRFWILGLSFLFFFFLSSGVKLSSWLIKLEPNEFKVITSQLIMPRTAADCLLGDTLIPELLLQLTRSIIWENLCGVMDMDMMTGCPNLCTFCGRGVHEEIGPSRIFLTFLLTGFQACYSQLQEFHPWGGFWCWWDLHPSKCSAVYGLSLQVLGYLQG